MWKILFLGRNHAFGGSFRRFHYMMGPKTNSCSKNVLMSLRKVHFMAILSNFSFEWWISQTISYCVHMRHCMISNGKALNTHRTWFKNTIEYKE